MNTDQTLDYSVAVVTAPTVEPVTLAEAKRHANVIASDDDDYIASLIVAAREMVETDANRAFVTQTLRVRWHDWPTTGMVLPKPPLQSVTSVKYLDTDDAEQTLGSANYDVDTDRAPGVVWYDPDLALPSLSDKKNAVYTTYVAGYGDAAADVPNRAKQAILLLLGHWYRVREAVGTVGDEVDLAYRSLIRSLKPGGYP